eukprot:TRINITY_DN6600_c0_g1_i1.p1 TRINITY_DN6600_c0_g1~~TRINITY_DN6600_c0_g1_i1.p1  ORF type:complete len:508 (+),score=138.41 TRINITY_DN6600_c0_g1_i1:138-1661(+)
MNQLPTTSFSNEEPPTPSQKWWRAFWMPSFPWIEAKINWVGVGPWIFSFFHLFWTLLTLPFHILFAFCVFIPLIGPIFEVPVARKPSWGLGYTLFLLMFQRFIWTFFFGLPTSRATPFVKNGIPFTKKFFSCSSIWRSVKREILGFNIVGDDVLDVEEVLIDSAPLDWLDGILDPNEIVVPGPVDCFWLRKAVPTRNNSRSSLLEEGRVENEVDKTKSKKVIMYLVQGGYIRSSGLEAPFAWTLAQETQTPLLSVEYRKAIDRSQTYPAALQDATAGYFYLLSIGYKREDIAVMGDSAGGGLTHALMVHMANLRQKNTKDKEGREFLVPAKAMMLSPWVDLTLSTQDQKVLRYDILYPQMEKQGAYCYTADARAKYYSNTAADAKAKKANYPSVPNFIATISPSVRTPENDAALDNLVVQCKASGGTHMLFMWGGAEASKTEVVDLLNHLKLAVNRKEEDEKSINIEGVEGLDGIHCYGTFYSAKSKDGQLFYDPIKRLINGEINSQ